MITIFTPTYNRGYILLKTYAALCCQTNKNFVWLIVDDGSTDGTEQLVETWIQEEKISIQYYFQQNGGKMRAHNRGISLCHTELFVCVDSDDYLVDDAVESIINLWKSVDKEEYLAGIVAYKGKGTTHTMFGEKFPYAGNTTMQELYRKGFTGETTLIFRTEILSRFPFPVFEGEKFIPEAVIYDQIDQYYSLCILPKVLTICEYRNDGLSRSINRIREENPKGWLFYYQQRIGNSYCSVIRYKYIVHAICFCWKLGYDPFKQIPAYKVEVLIGFPSALILKIMGRL